MFSLHPQLERDTFVISDMKLCRVFLMNNSLFPWLILVPRIENAKEIIDLADAERHLLMDEITAASHAIKAQFAPDKLNVAALGNQVPQLHIHVIARFACDNAWPQPVWGKGSQAYSAKPEALIEKLTQALTAAQ